MRRDLVIGAMVGCLAVSAAIPAAPPAMAQAVCPQPEPRKVRIGLDIAPVKLSFHPAKRAIVGYGSYIVNAQGGCNDCHTFPPYAPGGNPFNGEPERINAERYLGGGTPFGSGVVSANITPDARGLPAGLTYRQFREDVMRNGHDPDEPGEILQVMPWPIYGKMTSCDLLAVYEFLKAVPRVRNPT
jgi:hypothetical protein